jgi:hypothetical protein
LLPKTGILYIISWPIQRLGKINFLTRSLGTKN